MPIVNSGLKGLNDYILCVSYVVGFFNQIIYDYVGHIEVKIHSLIKIQRG